jgi:ubiquitin C-terminal hydrolase
MQILPSSQQCIAEWLTRLSAALSTHRESDRRLSHALHFKNCLHMKCAVCGEASLDDDGDPILQVESGPIYSVTVPNSSTSSPATMSLSELMQLDVEGTRQEARRYCFRCMDFEEIKYTRDLQYLPESLFLWVRRNPQSSISVQWETMVPYYYGNKVGIYKLAGVAMHLGEDDAGHYISFVANGDHPGMYWKCNDSHVESLDEADMLQLLAGRSCLLLLQRFETTVNNNNM